MLNCKTSVIISGVMLPVHPAPGGGVLQLEFKNLNNWVYQDPIQIYAVKADRIPPDRPSGHYHM